MHPAHYLQRLNLKSPSWQRSGAAFQALGWEDIAGALSMGKLSPIATTLARAKFCDDHQQRKLLLVLITEQVLELATKEQWQCRQAMLVKIARLACHELFSAHHCKTCSGRGINLHGLSCRYCHGLGRLPMTAAGRYRFASIDKRNWERRWQSRYERIYRQLCEEENQLLSHLSRQLHSLKE